MTTVADRVEQLYADRGQSARDLKSQGRSVIGYMCSMTPIEMIEAAGLVSYRMAGSMSQPMTRVGEHLEPNACSFSRSVFDLLLGGQYDFLDGYVIPHACDNIVKLYEIWVSTNPLPYAHFVNIPHTLSGPSFKFFEIELEMFRKSLERYSGRKITDDDLRRAIAIHNVQRKLVRQLYEFRKSNPPLITASEVTRVLSAVMSLPAEEANDLLRGVIESVSRRQPSGQGKKRPRVMLYGTGNEDTTFIDLLDSAGLDVVIDEVCFGPRSFWEPVKETGNPITALAERYLGKVMCPRTYREVPGGRAENLENRFGHIYRLAHEFEAQAVVQFLTRYCDCHAFDLPDLREYLQTKGLRTMVFEEEYPVSASGERLKTRIETFADMLG